MQPRAGTAPPHHQCHQSSSSSSSSAPASSRRSTATPTSTSPCVLPLHPQPDPPPSALIHEQPSMAARAPRLRSGSTPCDASDRAQTSRARPIAGSTRSATSTTNRALMLGGAGAGAGAGAGIAAGAVPGGAPSSYSQRQPARSFFQQASHAANDAGEYSTQRVREDTAQLASWALRTSPSGNDADIAALFSTSPKSSFGRASSSTRRDSLHPGRIEERTEPPTPNEDDDDDAVPPHELSSSLLGRQLRQRQHEGRASARRVSTNIFSAVAVGEASESTPLLAATSASGSDLEPSKSAEHDLEQQADAPSRKGPNQFEMLLAEARHRAADCLHTVTHPKSWSARAIFDAAVRRPVGLLPCVFLGLLLNVLDALSYGMILFPLGESVFANTGADGIAIFYVSCIVSQLVFSCGGSIFKGAVGSEMIEVVPFFHSMAYMITESVGRDRPDVILATTITAYAASSVLTGLVFFLLGCFKLGSLVNFFPRHILIGCIGGVGFFLVVTGLAVSARLDGNLNYDLPTARKLLGADTLLLWLVPLALSVLLLTVKHVRDAPWVVPVFFVSIAAVFYAVVAAVPSLTVPMLREAGWIFHGVAADVPFYHFYSYFDFAIVDWQALAATVPAMLALTFFGILHVPINVPALAIAAAEDDLNLNRELVAHGLSNALSGALGSIQNYLVYVNSDLFINNGGNDRLAGVLLAAATLAVLVAGPAMIGFVPVMVVGTLIFYLGIALLEEAVVDTWGKMNRLEYLTVLAIVLVMGVYDFVAGIFAGIVLACLNFVVQTSRKSAIRATYTGETVESTVRRHPIQRHFLHEVGYQTVVMKLAGYLFFGSIVQVEKQARALIEEEAFQRQAIRYLVFDLAHVSGIDYSAVEAFTRIERVLGRRDVHMVVSGVDRHSDVGKSLQSIGLWQDDSSVEFFETLNAALEYCENEHLKAFYRQRDVMRSDPHPSSGYTSPQLDIPKAEGGGSGGGGGGGGGGPSASGPNPLSASFSSPRQMFLKQAATTTLTQPKAQQTLHPPKRWDSYKQPLPLILQTFNELSAQTEDFWHRALPYFTSVHYPHGTVLFHAGDDSDEFYLVESGFLRATYDLPVGSYSELIVAGTTCGELPFFSNTKRTASLRVENEAGGVSCWILTRLHWERMQSEWPEGAREILTVALRLTKERVDAVTSYVLTAAG